MWYEILNVLFGMLLVLTFIAGFAALAYTAVRESWRERQLAQENPPTNTELAIVHALRKPGTVQVQGRTSAAARHFEKTQRMNPVSRDGGGQLIETSHPDGIVRRWRDQRSGR